MIVRAPVAVVLAILGVLAAAAGAFAVGSWTLEDMHVYLDAARRLRDGQPLYSTTNPLAAYQYAPWFAALWVPATYAPELAVSVVWSGLLLGASVLSVLPFLRARTPAGVAVVLLMLPVLIFSSARSGNVQPLLVAGLVTGLERRWGPVAIAAAASLKAFPLAFALVYLGRREWGRSALAIGLTVALVVPMLLFDLQRYTVDGPRAGTLFDVSPVAWALVVLVLVGTTLWLARHRTAFAWLAAATTVIIGLPRMLTYDLTFLLAGSPEVGRDVRSDASSANPTSTKLIS